MLTLLRAAQTSTRPLVPSSGYGVVPSCNDLTDSNMAMKVDQVRFPRYCSCTLIDWSSRLLLGSMGHHVTVSLCGGCSSLQSFCTSGRLVLHLPMGICQHLSALTVTFMMSLHSAVWHAVRAAGCNRDCPSSKPPPCVLACGRQCKKSPLSLRLGQAGLKGIFMYHARQRAAALSIVVGMMRATNCVCASPSLLQHPTVLLGMKTSSPQHLPLCGFWRDLVEYALQP